MELKELLSNMTSEELLKTKEEINKEIERRREGERSRLEDELKRLMAEIRSAGFYVQIDVEDNYYYDDEWDEISVKS